MAMTPKRWVITGVAVVVAVAVALAIWLFEPQALLINKTVEEAAPTSTAAPATPTASAAPGAPAGSAAPATPAPSAAANQVRYRGSFVSHAHETSGAASIIELPDGQLVVRISDFATSNGPDVRVWLSKAPASSGDSAKQFAWTDLGGLKGNRGNQNYPVPAAAAGQQWQSVYIWCDRFSVAFGAADLVRA